MNPCLCQEVLDFEWVTSLVEQSISIKNFLGSAQLLHETADICGSYHLSIFNSRVMEDPGDEAILHMVCVGCAPLTVLPFVGPSQPGAD